MTYGRFLPTYATIHQICTKQINVRLGEGHECPECQREAKWCRLKSEQAFFCQWCGHHIHPMVGSILEHSRTALQLWFYAIFLFTTTRNGVAAKELQHQLGVTYKTASRMSDLIREIWPRSTATECLAVQLKSMKQSSTVKPLGAMAAKAGPLSWVCLSATVNWRKR